MNSKAKRCKCTVTEGDNTGSWCVECGRKVLTVDKRECKDCIHSKKLIDGWICKKHLMSIIPNMHVTFHTEEGSCFEYK